MVLTSAEALMLFFLSGNFGAPGHFSGVSPSSTAPGVAPAAQLPLSFKYLLRESVCCAVFQHLCVFKGPSAVVFLLSLRLIPSMTDRRLRELPNKGM